MLLNVIKGIWGLQKYIYNCTYYSIMHEASKPKYAKYEPCVN